MEINLEARANGLVGIKVDETVDNQMFILILPSARELEPQCTSGKNEVIAVDLRVRGRAPQGNSSSTLDKFSTNEFDCNCLIGHSQSTGDRINYVACEDSTGTVKHSDGDFS